MIDIGEVEVLMTFSGLATETQIIRAGSTRDGLLVRTTKADYRLAEVELPSVNAAGWRVVDIAPELFAEPAMRSRGIAISEGRMLALGDPKAFYEFCVVVCESIAPGEVAVLAEGYLAAGPPRHVVDDATAVPVSAHPGAGGAVPSLAPPDWRCAERPADMRLTYDTWRFEADGGICLERWTMEIRDSAAVLESTTLASGLRWQPTED